jgi:hypothetical protein
VGNPGSNRNSGNRVKRANLFAGMLLSSVVVENV